MLLACAPLAAQPLAWVSPRQTALAGLVAPRPDAAAPLLNPAALGRLQLAEAGVAVGQLFGVAGLPVVAAGAAAPLAGRHRAGAGVVRLGTGSLAQTFAAASYAYYQDNTCLALQAGLYQLALGDAPVATVPTVSLFGQTDLIPKLSLAGAVLNLGQPRLRAETSQRLPAALRAAAAYQASPELLLLAQAERTLNRPATLSAGAEYQVHRYLRLRAGASPWPGLLACGFRLDVWGTSVEYGLAYHTTLGNTHSLGLGWTRRTPRRTRIEADHAP